MTATPETDLAVRGSNGQWSFGLRDLCERLERQRDAYAETLRELRDRLESYWSGLIEERHPELGSADVMASLPRASAETPTKH